MLALHLPCVIILGNDDYGKKLSDLFKRRGSFQYFLCHCDYAWIVLDSFHTKSNPNIMLAIDMCILN